MFTIGRARAALIVIGLSTALMAQTPADVREAAERGDPVAQHKLGLAYRNGDGVTRDLVEAYKWLSLAATRATAEHAPAYAAT